MGRREYGEIQAPTNNDGGTRGIVIVERLLDQRYPKTKRIFRVSLLFLRFRLQKKKAEIRALDNVGRATHMFSFCNFYKSNRETHRPARGRIPK